RDVPILARFYDQINLITKCSKVSLHALHSEQKSLEEGLKSLKHEAQVVIPTAGDTDAELATSILQHFATEVEHELEALQDLLDQMNASKSHFLEYFEEEETGEELDLLLGHISNFTAEFRREHKKYLEAQRQQRLKEQKELAQSTRH
uniref:FH2 domain-containing protein n=1 Tax=Globisporangium ultimum (strain ATCC 200006 / CBS 805.95 / DAOM BR144) TaxID=431595 RepID=K3X763_GLOUD